MHEHPGLGEAGAGLQAGPQISCRMCPWVLLRKEAGLPAGPHLLATLTPCPRRCLLRNRRFILH